MTEFPIKSDNKINGVFEKQWINFIAIIGFTVIFYYLKEVPSVISGVSSFGFTVEQLYWIAFFTPVLHQLIVWFFWRIQLYYNGMNRVFGSLAFPIYAILFALFFSFRLISIIMLAIGNVDSLIEIKTILWIIFIIILFPILYSFYSVKRYFGVIRAFGIDHFDPSYHSIPMVKEGIYKYLSNSMYWIALMALYLPGLYYASLGALLIALFNHIYIWVHYHTTEKPDMEKIYN